MRFKSNLGALVAGTLLAFAAEGISHYINVNSQRKIDSRFEEELNSNQNYIEDSIKPYSM